MWGTVQDHQPDQQSPLTFRERWAAAGTPRDWSPAERVAAEACCAVVNSTGFEVELDEHGHAYLAGRVAPEHFPRTAHQTPRDIREAVAFVEREARAWRRELLVAQGRAARAAGRPRAASARAGASRARASHSRQAGHRRTRTASSSSSDDPGLGDDAGPGEPAPLIPPTDWRES